jgi:hypothetical protein
MVFTFSGDRIGAAIRKTQRKMRMQSGYKWSKENTEFRNHALSASIPKQTNLSTTSAAADIGRRRSARALHLMTTTTMATGLRQNDERDQSTIHCWKLVVTGAFVTGRLSSGSCFPFCFFALKWL